MRWRIFLGSPVEAALEVEPAAFALTLTPVAPIVTQPIQPAAFGLTLGMPAPQINQQVVVGGGSYDDEVLALSPSGYWKLDDPSGTTAVDSSGNGNDGTLVNTPTLGEPALLPGLGASMFFNAGAGEYVTIPDDPTIRMAGDFSIVGVVMMDAGWQLTWLFSGIYTGDDVNYYLTGSTGAGTSLKPVIGYFDSGSGHANLQDDVDLTTEVPYHLVGTYDHDTFELKLYVDGVNVATSTESFGVTSESDGAYIGRRWDGGGENNWLSNIALFPSTLSPAQVATLAAAAAGGGASSFDLTLTPVAPEVELSVTPGAFALTLTPVAPEIQSAVTAVEPGVFNLTLTPVAPEVEQAVTPGAFGLTLTPVAPEVEQQVLPAALGLTLTPEAPAVVGSVSPAAFNLTLTPVAPSEIEQQVTPGAFNLTLTPEAPNIGGGITPAAFNLTLTPLAPTIPINAPLAALALALTPVAPTVTSPVNPGIAALVLALLSPTVSDPNAPIQAVPPAAAGRDRSGDDRWQRPAYTSTITLTRRRR